MDTKTIEQITIINAAHVTVSFSDGSSIGLKVGDSIDVSTITVAPESEVTTPEVAPAPVEEAPVVEAPAPETAPVEPAPAA